MQVASYPSSLPKISEDFTINVRTDKQTLIFNNKHIRNMRSLSKTRASTLVTWFFNEEQLETFNLFYIGTLDNGTLPFMIDLNFPNLVTVYFSTDYSYSLLTGTKKYRITASLVIVDNQI